jgi:KaiC/GvpD/RAD55 family RecA-like ATPase
VSALDITPDNPRIVLIFSPARSVRESNLAAVREVMEQGIGVVIVTINQPARSLARHYQKNGVDTASLRFIDTVTKYAGGDAQEDMPGSIFLHRPDDLTGLSIAITEALKDPGEQKTCILVDSINAMLIYISSADLLKFIHYLTSKLKILEISGIFLAVESGLDPALLARLTAISDGVIEIGGVPAGPRQA